ncbi:MAG: motility associated factor glycosyltransferase family protein, partial [bacterium]|nr:motility associated factor glycosyltransferase family protein [bacterium]
PGLLKFLLALPEQRYKTETARNGALTLTCSLNQTSYYLHSKFNPQNESAALVAKKDTSADHIVVMGLGLGYHLEKVMETKNKTSRVLLVEPESEILKHSLKTIRWKKLLNRGDFFYVFSNEMAELAGTVHSFLNVIVLDRVEFVELPSETRILSDFFIKARKTIENEIKTNLYDLKTRLAESFMLPRNILKNLPRILNTRPVARLQNAFPNTPGFIVSAGPSLDKNVLHLKNVRNRGLMIAVDTALKPLLKRALQPHFTAIGDPSHKNYLHLQGTENLLQHFIAAETGIARHVFRDFNDKIFTLSVGRPMARLIEAHSEPLGELEAWGSVISIALALAIYMGLNPIIFVGQDFAFTGTRNHCRGTSWEENKLEYTSDLAQLQRFEKQSISGNKKVIETRDIYGNKTYTSERLKLYKNYLARMVEQHPHTLFINATEGGIFSEIPHMPLKQVIKKFVYGRPGIDFNRIHQLPTLYSNENIRRLTDFFENKRGFFEEYLKKMDDVLRTLRAGTDFSRETALPVLDVADSVKNELYAETQNGEIVEMWSLSPIYDFLKGYKRVEQKQFNESYIKENITLYQRYFENIKPLIKDIIKRFKETPGELA